MKLIKNIKNIEAAAYPAHMQQLQDIETWGELAEYCEGTPDVLCTDTYYCIVCRETKEIIDLACVKPLTYAEIMSIAKWVGKGKWTADLRAETSGRLVKLLAKRRLCSLNIISMWDWCGIDMMEVEIEVF